ncbi:MAG: hypothetical protein ACUVRJ_01390 [Candidatus Villigracilaceae bacterium]
MDISAQATKVSLRKLTRPYQMPDVRRSLWQLVNTLIPYVGRWALMFLSLKVSYSLPAGHYKGSLIQ